MRKVPMRGILMREVPVRKISMRKVPARKVSMRSPCESLTGPLTQFRAAHGLASQAASRLEANLQGTHADMQPIHMQSIHMRTIAHAKACTETGRVWAGNVICEPLALWPY